MIATVTSKAQITFPKGIRELLQVEPGNKVDLRPVGRTNAFARVRCSTDFGQSGKSSQHASQTLIEL